MAPPAFKRCRGPLQRRKLLTTLIVPPDVATVPNAESRCAWPKSALSIAYHDHEWGVPLHDDRKLFEFILLDAAQAGLILRLACNAT